MSFLRDLRYGIRILLRAPVPTAVAILALALGIGVNLTSFASLNAVVLHPFSFPRLDRIVTLWQTPLKTPDDRQQFAPANFLDLQQQSRSFSEVAVYRKLDLNLTGVGDPLRVEAAEVTPSFFDILGVKPMMGRVFSANEGSTETARTAVISDGFWKSELAGTREAIGKRILLDGEAYTVIGVMPEDFDYPLSNRIWTALQLTGEDKSQRTAQSLQVLGLLKPGVTVEQCRSEAQQIAHRLRILYPASDEDMAIGVVRMRDLPDQATERFECLLLVCATFVLLLATANVGNLQVARATGRMRELAVRAALGASRARMLRQLLAEGLLLAAAGALSGLLLASWNLSIFKARIPADVYALVPGLRTMHVDGTVVEYLLVVSVAAGVLASIPAMLQLLRQSAALDLNERLKQGGRTSGYSAGLNRMQSFLIGYEVAMALVLLVGAAFLVKAFNGILAGSYGYNPDHVLQMQISLPAFRYENDARLVTFYDRALEQFQRTRGAQDAAVWTAGPSLSVFVEGRPAPRPGDFRPEADTVSAGYLRAMSVPLREGRFFSGAERPNSLRVAIVSETVAKRYWPKSDPIGQRIRLGNAGSPWITVIGISGDVVRDWLTKEPAPLIYLSYAQYPPRSTMMVVRTAGDPARFGNIAQLAVHKVDRDLPVYAVKTLNRSLYEQTSGVRAAADSMKQYAAVALLLAATGIFGVIAYFVAQRTRDIGIRIALGANTSDVLRMTLRRTMYPTAVGIAIGTAAAYGMTVFMTSLLFQLVKQDWLTFMGCVAALAATALAASYLPARRATRVDPLIALREN